MDPQSTLNIITICISTILSLGAIILSLWFYKESNKQNKETAIMQSNIKDAIDKLEQLYRNIYSDTFGVLKTQMDAMQNHIFISTVGEVNNSEPDQIRFSVLGCITEKANITIDDLCNQVTGFRKPEITEIVYSFHREGLVNFDGKQIIFLKMKKEEKPIEGQKNDGQ